MTPNAVPLAQAYFSKHAWCRDIYAEEAPVSFLMLEDQPEQPEYFLWGFMIDARYQKARSPMASVVLFPE